MDVQERDNQISRLRKQLAEAETDVKMAAAKDGKLVRMQAEIQAIREDRDKLLKICDQLLTDAEAAKAAGKLQA